MVLDAPVSVFVVRHQRSSHRLVVTARPAAPQHITYTNRERESGCVGEVAGWKGRVWRKEKEGVWDRGRETERKIHHLHREREGG